MSEKRMIDVVVAVSRERALSHNTVPLVKRIPVSVVFTLHPFKYNVDVLFAILIKLPSVYVFFNVNGASVNVAGATENVVPWSK